MVERDCKIKHAYVEEDDEVFPLKKTSKTSVLFLAVLVGIRAQ
jgi:hypothetical protein